MVKSNSRWCIRTSPSVKPGNRSTRLLSAPLWMVFGLADMQGHFLDVNEAYCHLIGYSRDELLNMSIPDIEAIEKLKGDSQTHPKDKGGWLRPL